MPHLEPRRRTLSYLLVLASCIGLALSVEACYRWRARPLTNIDLQKESLRSRDIRLQTDSGEIVMHLQSLQFPFVFGQVKSGRGRAAIDSRTVTRPRVVELDRSEKSATTIDEFALDDFRRNPSLVDGKSIVVYSGGNVVLRNAHVLDDGWIEGGLARGSVGNVRVDLRNVKGLAVREIDGPRTALATVGVIVGTVAAVAIIVALTKESCPFVYVDRGEGWELVGEAYAGAAFRSTQRGDLLPLPAIGPASTVSVRLRNEARETQYTDQAEVVVADHARTVRALSTFDGKVITVRAPQSPRFARDRAGRDVTRALVARDEILAETTIPAVAAVREGPLADEITATFALPATGEPVLELVGGNTTLLDLVFGRFFAAMGDRLTKYLAQGNEPAAGPRIQGWREREGVDLIVEVRDGDGWTKVGVVPTVGPAALREIAVPLPVSRARNGDSVQVRLRSGLGFWRFDRLALSARDDSPVAVVRVAPRAAVGSSQRDERATLTSADGRYNALSEINESVEMQFDLPALARDRARSVFLYTNGYYNVHPPIQSEWLPGTLKAIRDQPGALSRFGHDLARAYEAAAAR